MTLSVGHWRAVSLTCIRARRQSLRIIHGTSAIEVPVPVHNADIARVFDEIADLLDIQGENAFRIRAYRNAARTIGEFPRDLKALIDSGTEVRFSERRWAVTTMSVTPVLSGAGAGDGAGAVSWAQSAVDARK